MKNIYKLFALLLTISLLFTLLVSCGGNSGNDSSKSTDAPAATIPVITPSVTVKPTEEPTEAPTEAPTEEPAPQDKTYQSGDTYTVTLRADGTFTYVEKTGYDKKTFVSSALYFLKNDFAQYDISCIYCITTLSGTYSTDETGTMITLNVNSGLLSCEIESDDKDAFVTEVLAAIKKQYDGGNIGTFDYEYYTGMLSTEGYDKYEYFAQDTMNIVVNDGDMTFTLR